IHLYHAPDLPFTYISPPSLHDALPISRSLASTSATDSPRAAASSAAPAPVTPPPMTSTSNCCRRNRDRSEALRRGSSRAAAYRRSEEHTSELQSRENLVCRLLHEKKNR